MACDSGVSLVNLGPSGARSCLALLTCSLPSTGRDLSQGILSDFAEKPQVLRLRLAPRTRQTPLRMTTLVGISTEPSCLMYAFSASARDLRPALIAGLIPGVSGFGLFMRRLPVCHGPNRQSAGAQRKPRPALQRFSTARTFNCRQQENALADELLDCSREGCPKFENLPVAATPTAEPLYRRNGISVVMCSLFLR